jgi:predicted AAA+ superfamily ATPase
MTLYNREIATVIDEWLSSREILIIFGTRQVGKSTLLHMMLDQRDDSLILNCERPSVHEILQSRDLTRIRSLFGEKTIIALDEAHVIENIGQVLKLIFDDEPDIKMFVTGSSSFELSNKIAEPLTGRNIKFRLYPLSLKEIRQQKNWIWIVEHLRELLIYGSYPGIVDLPVEKKKVKLEELAGDYLFKDILVHEGMKQSGILLKLVRLLAFQIGNLTSINELSIELGISIPTVQKFIDLLEKTFIIFSLSSFSTNLRNEIKKQKKYYFCDVGIRNAIIGNFSPSESRMDIGILWENFCMIERIKYNQIHNRHARLYFWRTYDGAEIDLIEVADDRISAFEFKWNPRKKGGLPLSFAGKHPGTTFKVINPENLNSFLE